VAWAEAYLLAKFHLDPSNRLATIHQRHRQERQENGPIASGEPFYKRSSKNYAYNEYQNTQNVHKYAQKYTKINVVKKRSSTYSVYT